MTAQSALHRVGQHFLLGLRPGPALDPRDRDILCALRPAGVIVFRDNFDHAAPYPDWHAGFAALLRAVAGCLDRERFIIAIDHEGARVMRPPAPVTRFDHPARWADQAAAVGAAMGRELASLGINLNFAPLLDVDSNPDNPVIGRRAFATTAAAVAAAAPAFARAMQAERVLACGKHFPGHGDASVDSHLGLPVIAADRATLDNRELLPFAAAIAAAFPALMTGHLSVPALDPAAPTTLSAPSVRDLLRRDMGYQGLVVTDDIGMHAMDGHLADPAASVGVFAAGHDMLMICAHATDTARVIGFAEALARAGEDAAFAATVLEPSRRRIDRFLAALPMTPPHLLPAAVFEQHATLAPLYQGARAQVV